MYSLYNLCINGLPVCLFVSNKRQNSLTDRAQICCGISCDPREGLWMINIKNFVFESFYLCKKNLNLKNPQIFQRYNEHMFTIATEDGSEAL